MRRFIYGSLLTLMYCLLLYLLIGFNGLATLVVVMEGLSLALLWDIGVISNVKIIERKYAKEINKEQEVKQNE